MRRYAWLLLVLAAAPAQAQQVFVSPAAIAADVATGRVVVLDVGRPDSAWARGRLPGARRLPFATIVTTRDGIPNELPPVARLDSVFESLGVGDDTRVLLYGDVLAAARAWVTLDLLGHRHALLLDGGLPRWVGEGHPLSTADAPPPGAARFSPRLDSTRLVDAAWVHARLADPAVTLVDARSPGEFAGTTQSPQVPRPGHVPGARSVFWRRLLQSDSLPALRPRAELESLLALPAGATRMVAYCRTGHMASMLYAVARELGRPVVLYDPSFVEWSGRGDLPVEQGSPGR